LVMLFRDRLEKLTHGAEDNEQIIHDETAGLEIADN